MTSLNLSKSDADVLLFILTVALGMRMRQKLEIAGDKLLVTNGKGEQYKLDLKTRKVEKMEKDAGKDK